MSLIKFPQSKAPGDSEVYNQKHGSPNRLQSLSPYSNNQCSEFSEYTISGFLNEYSLVKGFHSQAIQLHVRCMCNRKCQSMEFNTLWREQKQHTLCSLKILCSHIFLQFIRINGTNHSNLIRCQHNNKDMLLNSVISS